MFKLPDKVYDILKWICILVLPATAVLYGTLGVIWGWAYVDQIVKTINAIDLFIGTIIGVSTIGYNKSK